MIVALEGPDRVGKTTVWRELKTMLPCKFIGNVATSKALMDPEAMRCAEAKCASLLEDMYDPDEMYVMDRCPFVSNLAYAVKYGREFRPYRGRCVNDIRVIYFRATVEMLTSRGTDIIDTDAKASIDAYESIINQFVTRIVDASMDVDKKVIVCARFIRDWGRRR